MNLWSTKSCFWCPMSNVPASTCQTKGPLAARTTTKPIACFGIREPPRRSMVNSLLRCATQGCFRRRNPVQCFKTAFGSTNGGLETTATTRTQSFFLEWDQHGWGGRLTWSLSVSSFGNSHSWLDGNAERAGADGMFESFISCIQAKSIGHQLGEGVMVLVPSQELNGISKITGSVVMDALDGQQASHDHLG